MSDFIKLRTEVIHSNDSDFSNIAYRSNIPEYDSNGCEVSTGRMKIVSGSAKTLETGYFTTIDYVVVKCSSSSAGLGISVTRDNDAAATVVDKVGVGKIAIFTDVDPASDIDFDSVGVSEDAVIDYIVAGAT